MVSIEDITSQLKNTKVATTGVSFEGKSLKLDTANDAKPVVEAIDNCPYLEYLNLQGNTLGVEASSVIAKALEKHPEFKRAQWQDMFTGRMKTEIPKALQFLGNGLVTAGAKLTELDLSDNALGPIGVEGLASLLRSSSCYALEELRLNNNGLGIGGGKLLASALLDCYNSSKSQGKPLSLKVFIVGRNRLENDGAKALAEVFSTIGTLEEIEMPQNGIYNIGITALSNAFKNNLNLKVLNLNDNTIGPKGSKAIASVLPQLKELREINFGDCLLLNKGAITLAHGLKHCMKLEQLMLAGNEIKSDGGIQLIKALINKEKLVCVNLGANKFGSDGCEDIKTLLKDVGKLNTLESLSDDESAGSDDDDDDEEDEDEDDDEKVNDETGTESDHENEINEIDNNNGVLDSKVTVEDFLKEPTSENFLSLGDNVADLLLKEVEKNNQTYSDSLLVILMKVASLSVCKSKEVCEKSLKCTDYLYKKIFTMENDGNYSLVNNSLLVHLGLIKSEDKKELDWDLGGCLKALQSALRKSYLPDSTKSVLWVFLEK
nr:ran GTPase-activating protein 1 [Onthophagus taurus]